MENTNIKTEVVALIAELKEYASLRSTLLGLQIKGMAADLIAGIGSNLVLVIFSCMGFFFGSFALAFYLSEKYNSNSTGFLIVAGIYFVLFLIALMLKNSFKNFIRNTIIAQLFKETNYENDSE